MTEGTVRLATAEDLTRLAEIERSSDTLLAEHFGRPLPDEPIPSGTERLDERGFIVVAGEPAVGFAHVVDLGGFGHLEQLSVASRHVRQGIGSRLLLSAIEEAVRRGLVGMSLTTYAEVPFNAPWYAAHGFVVLPDTPPPLRSRREYERSAGYDALGRRVVMFRPIGDPVPPAPAVSVIPVRDGPSGLEVFVQHRVATMDFAAGAVVYPGGRVDPGDATTELPVSGDHLRDVTTALAGTAYVSDAADPELAARTLLACGVRELREETGVDCPPTRLVPWDNWVTPPGLPKRFDVIFFVAHLPAAEGWAPTNTTTEAHLARWTPAVDLIAAAERGDVHVMVPNRVILDELADLGSVAAVLAQNPVIEAVHFDRTPPRPRPSRGSVSGSDPDAGPGPSER